MEHWLPTMRDKTVSDKNGLNYAIVHIKQLTRIQSTNAIYIVFFQLYLEIQKFGGRLLGVQKI